jgi:hypothetical protein
MTTFDLAEVRDFTADISTRMNGCEIDEGTECATLDAILRRHADVCREFCDQVRRWRDAIFAGRVEFDPEVERVWREEGARVHSQAMWAWECGRGAEGRCYDLEGQDVLRDAMGDLDRLLGRWVSPRLAVGPAGRLGLIPGYQPTEEGRQRVASLPPLPAGWEPDDRERQAIRREFRSS